ncbi:DUF2905 domain-containing protein [bacterium]|nr:DUF2905 domain-containing protein [bacterium]
MKPLAMALMSFGAILLVAGALLYLAAKFNLPLGRLPGDINLHGKGWSVSIPLMTCIILSILLTIILNLFFRR